MSVKTAISAAAGWFLLGDHEFIKATFGPWPMRFFVTVIERRYRRGWKKFIPWRLRCSLARLITSWIHAHCTLCGRKITIRELVDRSKEPRLTYFMSGSICHRDCRVGRPA